jgi:tRNA modification GTPase
MAAPLFRADDGTALQTCPSHRRLTGRLTIENDQPAPPVVVYLFKAPTSYTGQDLVEFHLPGSPVLLEMSLRRLFEAGARQAQPGEFTARAFVNRRMDLTEAEGVAAIINARSDAQLAAANKLAHGAVSKQVNQLQERLADLLSLVEADIDFSDEGLSFITSDQLGERVSTLAEELERIRSRAQNEEQLDYLSTVALVGPPNVGKSSLLNALSGLDRAICSPMPGTTRDILSAPVELGKCEALLVDMAGLGTAGSSIEQGARELARSMICQADLILFVIDLSLDPPRPRFELLDSLRGGRDRILYVANKTDLLNREEVSVRCESLRAERGEIVWPVSALTGAGLDRLRGLLESRLRASPTGAGRELPALNARHIQAVETAESALKRAGEICRAHADLLAVAELLACELREAADELAAITGKVSPENLLSRIFGRFCIGK